MYVSITANSDRHPAVMKHDRILVQILILWWVREETMFAEMCEVCDSQSLTMSMRNAEEQTKYIKLLQLSNCHDRQCCLDCAVPSWVVVAGYKLVFLTVALIDCMNLGQWLQWHMFGSNYRLLNVERADDAVFWSKILLLRLKLFALALRRRDRRHFANT